MKRRAKAATTGRTAARPSTRKPSPGRGPDKRLSEALAQQAATSEILRLIRSSPTDAQPVFDMIAERAMRLCGAVHGGVVTFDGVLIHSAAHSSATPEFAEALARTYPMAPARTTAGGRVILTGDTVYIPDFARDPEYRFADTARAAGFHSTVAVPMLFEGAAIGAIVVLAGKKHAFSERQIELLRTFADEAVIAIQNVRLFKERDARNGELSETLAQQTATAEILRVISRSPTDVQPVFEAIVASAARLCEAEFSAVARFDPADGLLHLAATNNMSAAETEAYHSLFPRPPLRNFIIGRAFVDGRAVHVEDVLADPDYDPRTLHVLSSAATYRTFLGVPIVRHGVPIGVVGCGRHDMRPFTPAQIDLVKTFADQAVIAIENVRLFKELQARNTALTESLDQQTATGEILRVISSSPTDVQPVFDTIVRSAVQLCDGVFSALFRYDGELIDQVAQHNFTPEALEEVRRLYPARPSRAHGSARAILERAVVHIPDVDLDPEYVHRGLTRAVGLRSGLFVPMMKDGNPLGAIMVARAEAGPFSASQIELLKTFADQAVIAIENVRLFKELEARNSALSESLEQQTATGEILRVISSSPTDVQPVFDSIAASAVKLCDGQFCHLFRFDGEMLHFVAHHGLTPEGVEAVSRGYPMKPGRGSAAARSVLGGTVVQIPDVDADPEYIHGAIARIVTFRSILGVPMMRDGAPIGAIAISRSAAGLFPDRQVALLKTFADQAVIAIENVRLFTELEARNGALIESLEQQTATSEILRVISSSPTDIQPVLDAVAESAARLTGAVDVTMFQREGDRLRLVAHHGPIPAQPVLPLVRGTANGRTVLEGRTVHVLDMQAETDDFPQGSENARLMGHRTVLCVPLIREGAGIGTIHVRRAEAQLFTDRQVGLLQTFADQAVIAIENVRLFKELETRNRALTESLEQQTATSEILRVISSSPTDVQPVFDTIVASAVRLCGARMGAVYRFDGELSHLATHYNYPPHVLEALQRMHPKRPETVLASDRAILGRAVTQIEDTLADPHYPRDVATGAGGFRSVLAVPMLRDGSPIGAIVITRTEPGRFGDGHVELLKTFADQAVIAVENVRLFTELEARTRELTRSVGELRALGEVSQAVSSTLDLEAVLATIVSRAVELSGSDQGVIYEFDEDSRVFRVRATHEISPAHLDVMRATPIRLGEGAIGRAGVTRTAVQVGDIQADWQLVAPQVRAMLQEQGISSALAVPLVREDRLLGGLAILRRERGAYSDEVVAMIQTFATQSVLAIQNARLFNETQRQKQYSDALVETSPVAIVTMDLHGAVVAWNPGAERLFGYAQAEAIGREVDQLIATPEIRDDVLTTLQGSLAGDRVRTITRRARKDGTLLDVEVFAVPISVAGTQVGSIAIYHDITELLQARREAEAANEAKSAFLATMSHEIRTPMNAVIGMSGLLLNTVLTEEQREYAEVVRQSGDALLTVINDILDFSKIEAGRLELESQPFDLRECVEGALDLVSTRAAEKGLDLAYVMGEAAPGGVVGDVTRLRQILLNLLSNAVKFTEKGEVVVTVSARPVSGAAGVHELTFSVRDTGIGIPKDRLDRLFQSFSQIDASTTRRYGGTGLGLAISQRLAELMGGRIVVTSEVGVGSEFRFSIRATAAAVPVTSRRDLSGVQPSLRGKRVLVVDDNATNRRILTAHLDAWGMHARASASPTEALRWVQAGERFDLAILDMHMPEMDGVALAHAIRGVPAGAALPLILFTSLGRREARAESEGFAAYLNKPIKPSQLFDALVSVLPDQPVHVPQRPVQRSEFDPELGRRHPLRILLAEDNVVNQKLALRLLAQMGYRADLAANGLEAVDAVARQTYDVVLMDVQMPELDGFEASREINRRWPGERRPRIVAMTANAMQGDRELCEAAGMDDYVAKPIRVDELVAALERCTRRPQDAAHGGGPAAAPASEPVERAVYDQLTATMGGEFVAELTDTFVEDGRELVATLRRSLAAIDVDAFRRAAHSLKSNSETLGAMRLAGLARELETAARSGRLDGTHDRVEPLAREYEAVAYALGDLRRGLSA